MDVILLLQAKGRCLEKFLQASLEGLAVLETGNFSLLQELERKREQLLKALTLYEGQITEAVKKISPDQRNMELSLGITQELAGHEHRLARIQSVDDRITALIVDEQERIRTEIMKNQRAQEQTAQHQKFKSVWVAESGGELDRKL